MELQHHGIKGMRWGVRRFQNDDGTLTSAGSKRYGESGGIGGKIHAYRTKRADYRDRAIDRGAKLRKLKYELQDEADRDAASYRKMTPRREKALNFKLAANKANYNDSKIVDDYAKARNQAIRDKSYKKSEGYKKAAANYNKMYSDQMMYGPMGRTRIEAFKNLGYSDRKARGRVAGEAILGTVGTVAVSALAQYYMSKQ